MSDSTVLSLNQLPPEILHSIFHHLDIPDILRLRRASRYLNENSHSRDVWSDAYRKATFVRPPGPFPSQSTDDLEDALTTSFRVDRNLRHGSGMAQKERPKLKLREIRYTGLHIGVSLVFARFLLIAFKEEVRCHDLSLDAFDSNSGATIIYRSTGGILKSFYCASAIDVQGRPFACVVLNEETQTTRQISIFLFNVEERSDVTLDLLHQFNYQPECIIQAISLGPRVIVIVGRNPNANYPIIALDVHTRIQLLLPSFINATGETSENTDFTASELYISGVSTSTHLLLARSSYVQTTGWNTFFEAFPLPSQDSLRRSRTTSTPLSPSHRGTIPRTNAIQTFLLHDAIIDPTTEDVLIAIRVHVFERSPFISSSKHGILHLSAAPTSHNSKIGTITLQLLDSLGGLPATPFLHPSFNGTGRVFYVPERGNYESISVLEYNLCARDNERAKVVEYDTILRFQTPHKIWDYDPYSGRLCLCPLFVAKYNVMEILDLAV